MDNPKKTAVIIGGSGSLGEHIARKFADKGYSLLLTGRKIEKLNIVSDNIQIDYPDIIIEKVHLLKQQISRPKACTIAELQHLSMLMEII